MANDIGAPQFGAAKDAYAKFRPTYPDELYDILLQKAPAPHACAADLGAGTGLASSVLAKHFETVIAVEPDAVMLAAGRFAPNVQLQNTFAEDAVIPPASCQLVTCANSFYWMDGERLLFEINRWLTPGGVFAAWRYQFPLVRSGDARQYLQTQLDTLWAPYRHARLQDDDYTLRTVESSALFTGVQTLLIPNTFTLTPVQLTGFLTSTSYVTAYLATLPDKDAYVTELESSLAAFMGQAAEVDFGLELILGQR